MDLQLQSRPELCSLKSWNLLQLPFVVPVTIGKHWDSLSVSSTAERRSSHLTKTSLKMFIHLLSFWKLKSLSISTVSRQWSGYCVQTTLPDVAYWRWPTSTTYRTKCITEKVNQWNILKSRITQINLYFSFERLFTWLGGIIIGSKHCIIKNFQRNLFWKQIYKLCNSVRVHLFAQIKNVHLLCV